MLKNRKHIINFVCLAISVIIYILASLMGGSGQEVGFNIYFVVAAVFIVAIYMLQFFYIRSCKDKVGKYGFLVAKFVCMFFNLNIAVFLSFGNNISTWLLFADLIFTDFGYYLVSLIFPNDIKFKPLKYYQKLLEVLKQFVLIFFSVFVTICFVYWFICGHYLGKLVEEKLIYDNLKLGGYDYGKSYYVGDSVYTVKKKISHDIRDSSGNVIGSYDTIEEEKEYDDGYIHEGGTCSDSLIWLCSIFALPLRLISFLFSVIALIIPTIYVSVKTPKSVKKETYKDYPFLILDLIIPNKIVNEDD